MTILMLNSSTRVSLAGPCGCVKAHIPPTPHWRCPGEPRTLLKHLNVTGTVLAKVQVCSRNTPGIDQGVMNYIVLALGSRGYLGCYIQRGVSFLNDLHTNNTRILARNTTSCILLLEPCILFTDPLCIEHPRRLPRAPLRLGRGPVGRAQQSLWPQHPAPCAPPSPQPPPLLV